MHSHQNSTIFALRLTRTTNRQIAHNMLTLWYLYIHLTRNNLLLMVLANAMLVGVRLYMGRFPTVLLIALTLPLVQLYTLQQIDKLSGARQMAHALPLSTDQLVLAKTTLCAALLGAQCAVAIYLAMGQWGWLAAIVAFGTAALHFITFMIIYAIFD